MRRQSILQWSAALGLITLAAGILFAQNPSNTPSTPSKTLVVNGKTASAPVVQMDGHSYIDIESLAQSLNGTVSFEPNRIVLTVPEGAPAETGTAAPPAATPTEPAPPVSPPGLSRNFASAAITALTEMREWKGAVTAIISYGIPVVGSWPEDYRSQARAAVQQAAIAAATDEDQEALPLLQNEFSNLEAWADNVVANRQALNAAPNVDPNALANDTALAKISACGTFLSDMIVSGMFADDPSCH